MAAADHLLNRRAVLFHRIHNLLRIERGASRSWRRGDSEHIAYRLELLLVVRLRESKA
jgi:hypothetical protein